MEPLRLVGERQVEGAPNFGDFRTHSPGFRICFHGLQPLVLTVVPVLVDGAAVVWDSSRIIEHLREKYSK